MSQQPPNQGQYPQGQYPPQQQPGQFPPQQQYPPQGQPGYPPQQQPGYPPQQFPGQQPPMQQQYPGQPPMQQYPPQQQQFPGQQPPMQQQYPGQQPPMQQQYPGQPPMQQYPPQQQQPGYPPQQQYPPQGQPGYPPQQPGYPPQQQPGQPPMQQPGYPPQQQPGMPPQQQPGYPPQQQQQMPPQQQQMPPQQQQMPPQQQQMPPQQQPAQVVVVQQQQQPVAQVFVIEHGKTVHFQSKNFPHHHWGQHPGKEAYIVEGKGHKFKIHHPGLTGQPGTVSFEDMDAKGIKKQFLRHQNWAMWIHPNENNALFHADATFRVHDGFFHPGCHSFESVNYPDHFIRHQNFRLHIAKKEHMNHLYKEDSSFYIQHDGAKVVVVPQQQHVQPVVHVQPQPVHVAPVVVVQPQHQQPQQVIVVREGGQTMHLQSKNFPGHHWGQHPGKEAFIVQGHGHRFKVHHPGLTGQHGTVSFEDLDAKGMKKHFLRHKNWEMWIHPNENNALFHADATFRPHEGLFNHGFHSFESVNYPDHFIRHQNFRLHLSKKEHHNHLWKEDSSFKYQHEGQVVIVQQPQHHQPAPVVVVQPQHHQPQPHVVVVQPQHHQQPHHNNGGGSHAIHSKNFHNHHWGGHGHGHNIEAKIMEHHQEHFRVHRPGLTGHHGTVSFESLKHPGHFLRHQNWVMFLHGREHHDLFHKDATFHEKHGHFHHGWDSFESVNYPHHFIRHKNFRLHIEKAEHNHQYKDDACFKIQ